MSDTAMDIEREYTYRDYAAWPGDARCELVDGRVYMMQGASVAHQKVSDELFSQIYAYLKSKGDGRPGHVYHLPLDVRLDPNGKDNTVVQPDILFVCDAEKLRDGKSCQGAPDWIVEVRAPATSVMDSVTKFNAYRAAGVREYWLVVPEGRYVTAFVLHDGQYIAYPYDADEQAPVHVLDGLVIDLAAAFPPKPPQQGARQGPQQGKPYPLSDTAASPGAEPEAAHEDAPEASHEDAPEATHESAHEDAPEASPEAAAEGAPEATYEAKPEATPEASPVAATETAFETAAEAAPEDAPPTHDAPASTAADTVPSGLAASYASSPADGASPNNGSASPDDASPPPL